jgi:IclR family acetate operon transcriptional repressor
MIPYTANTCVTLSGLNKDLRLTRERGFAISQQEFEKDINAVAAPILDDSGYPVAVIAVAGPSYRLSLDQMNKIGISIQQATEAIAREGGVAVFSKIISNRATPGLAG